MHKITNARGFTLIEVLIAIFLLVVGLLGAAGVVTVVIQGNAFGKEITTATTLAQDKMEEIKNLGYSGAPAVGTTATEDYNSIADYPLYKRVTAVADSAPSGMKEITVTVSWTWNNNERNVIIKTILAS